MALIQNAFSAENAKIEVNMKARQAIADDNVEIGLQNIEALIQMNPSYEAPYDVLEFALQNGKIEIFEKLLKTQSYRYRYFDRLLNTSLELKATHVFDKLWLEYKPIIEPQQDRAVTNKFDAVDAGKETTEEFEIEQSKLKRLAFECNPVYIILTSEDPLLYAIDKSNYLNTKAFYDAENKNELKTMSENCKRLTVDLLDCCENYEEINHLLKGKNNENDFLQTYVDNELMEFITHSYCQHWLRNKWLGVDLRSSWKKKNLPLKCVHFISHLIFFFLFSIYEAIINPKVRSPFNCFVYAVGSYMFFLLILLVSVFHDKIQDERKTVSFAEADYAASIWIITYFIQAIINLKFPPYKKYWRSWWTCYELITHSLFIFTGLLYLSASFLFENDRIQSYKIILGAEGIYAVAITLAFMRTLQWLHMSSALGPEVISFSRMTSVIFKLLLIFAIVLLSFSFGLYRLYRDFHIKNLAQNNTHLPNENSSLKSGEEGHFTSYTATLKVLFWVIFGYGDSNYVVIPSTYYWNMNEDETIIYLKQRYTMVIGYIMWALFHVAFIIVLLNMLIAILTTSYEIIKEKSDDKWKLMRTKLWFYYMKRQNAIPPPLNFILCILYGVNKWKCLQAHKTSDEVDAHQVQPKRKHQKYQKTIQQLVYRYQWKKCANINQNYKLFKSFADSRKLHTAQQNGQKTERNKSAINKRVEI